MDGEEAECSSLSSIYLNNLEILHENMISSSDRRFDKTFEIFFSRDEKKLSESAQLIARTMIFEFEKVAVLKKILGTPC